MPQRSQENNIHLLSLFSFFSSAYIFSEHHQFPFANFSSFAFTSHSKSVKSNQGRIQKRKRPQFSFFSFKPKTQKRTQKSFIKDIIFSPFLWKQHRKRTLVRKINSVISQASTIGRSQNNPYPVLYLSECIWWFGGSLIELLQFGE